MNIENTNISYTETQMDKLKKENGFTLLEVLVAITVGTAIHEFCFRSSRQSSSEYYG
jgi:prepilin-type N-terminal cleavage/methylation domain-containing protein